MSKSPRTSAELLQEGRLHHDARRFQQAEQCYREVLNITPQHHEALHLLGLVAHQQGQREAAIQYLTEAVRQQPRNQHYLNNLGEAYRVAGQLELAYEHYQRALEINPDHAEAHYNLGHLFLKQDKPELSEQHWRQALASRPDYLKAHLNIGKLLMGRGTLAQAAGHLRCVVALQPDNLEAHLYLADLHQRNNQLQQAISHYNDALALAPHQAPAIMNRANACKGLGKLEEAIVGYREAIKVRPDYALAHMNLGITLKDQDKTTEALDSFSRAIAIDPSLYKARLGYCISQIPVLYDSADAIAEQRQRYSDALHELECDTPLDTPDQINTAASAIGGLQPFYLAYQGRVDLDLQKRYGALVHRIQKARFPDYSQPLLMPVPGVGERIRVGILSGFFNSHSNWKIPIKGWVENMDRQQFELFGYHVGTKHDRETVVAQAAFEHFFHSVRSLEQWAGLIRSHNLHVLIAPETGMDPLTVGLAALRLAPVQCTSWGHPQTSGLPTVDYFLSSDLMEPVDADAHYSETLVRLPNLSIHYTPVDVEPAAVSRTDMGLREQGALYFCAQSLFKYLPQYDDVFVDIARQVPDAEFLFLAYGPSHELTERFRQRLHAAFARQGLDGGQFVTILPQQDKPHFHALNRLADVFLDSIGWSGCNSSLEAIAHDLPIVSYPGELMRGRHTLAILTMMGMQDDVITSLDQYVSQAVRMAQEPAYRNDMSRTIRERKQRCYYDQEPVGALEEFIKKVVAGSIAK